MHSLFTKIFLAIWLTLLLFGLALFVAERQLGDSQLEIRQQWLQAHAQSAAAVYALDGEQALLRWLRNLRQQEGRHILLLDQQGRLTGARGRSPAGRSGEEPPRPAVQRDGDGHSLLTAAIEGTTPPLFLAMRVDMGRLQGLGRGTRLALALLISILVSLALAFALSRPLRRLRHAVQQMAAGELQVRTGSRGKDEIAMLARDFDRMAERLQGMLENRKQLLSDVSHELRSPLARLRVALELAEQGGTSAKALARIGKEADELEHLVSHLLSLARLDADRLLLQREAVDLGQLLSGIARDARFEAEAAQRRVHLEGTTRATVSADAVLLRSAIENVVRNAIRHTAAGTAVTIHLDDGPQAVVIRVCDHGEGVPEEALARIFEPFTRLTEARERQSGGHGLGLSITARVIAAHQGRVKAQNRDGGGLCVEITLPRRQETV